MTMKIRRPKCAIRSAPPDAARAGSDMPARAQTPGQVGHALEAARMPEARARPSCESCCATMGPNRRSRSAATSQRRFCMSQFTSAGQLRVAFDLHRRGFAGHRAASSSAGLDASSCTARSGAAASESAPAPFEQTRRRDAPGQHGRWRQQRGPALQRQRHRAARRAAPGARWPHARQLSTWLSKQSQARRPGPAPTEREDCAASCAIVGSAPAQGCPRHHGARVDWVRIKSLPRHVAPLASRSTSEPRYQEPRRESPMSLRPLHVAMTPAI
jgi:hypothetical protein